MFFTRRHTHGHNPSQIGPGSSHKNATPCQVIAKELACSRSRDSGHSAQCEGLWPSELTLQTDPRNRVTSEFGFSPGNLIGDPNTVSRSASVKLHFSSVLTFFCFCFCFLMFQNEPKAMHLGFRGKHTNISKMKLTSEVSAFLIFFFFSRLNTE